MADNDAKEDKKAAKAQAKADKKAEKAGGKSGDKPVKKEKPFSLARRLMTMFYWFVMIAGVSALVWQGFAAYNLFTGN
ncbi:hypothetical protein KO525_03450 [Psychrosphaera sp. B3R10]|uniref:Uncharacterized protein n=1 Tax=Psychrosphaera algicola TaxID=3023714 RepID=A0ABT5F950_9GAMM|nr:MULTISPECIES: hypothetical protein [unclassified Psychrosphaera]MBU2881332.1 hypothetical protein [Psychrosphaera sp. I2R16]MBU2988431.1 hypothetical protein [Psychrosphaera sp. B3R10]MDC2888057.1 hypothetical protein [Psychrosphaera sp. G1-22]MDO6720069.1 hypothetical protein [Psychrosphaera sp. 1_MG-2023]